MPQDETQTETEPLQRLADLLPKSSSSLAASSFFREEEVLAALNHSIRSHINAGWKWAAGLLEKDGRKAKPTAVMRSKSGELDFNPQLDAFAVRMGARFVSDNRYHLGGPLYVDRNGMFVDPAVCSECGGAPWSVKTREGVSPNAPPWVYNMTYCRRCVAPDEVQKEEQAEQQRLLDAAPKRRPEVNRRGR